ncbi:DUF5658 family protein [Haloquadratum walsbyi]|uniref:DUF5658 domain-containing protein n=1 Tax=Haloquadratum walsbyi J07HQW2 TaxID=1238425 RepID=U1PX66_9EURY|nr:DUF5658 family protein [Haloquadratum walsbyi]ERG97041.1 MAG: hypothetical protein J07HQW2_03527 [Haloquadratum walsbyi J07HQW2]
MTNKNNDSEKENKHDRASSNSSDTRGDIPQEATASSPQSVTQLLSSARTYDHTVTAILTAGVIVVFHLLDKQSLATRAQAFMNPPDTETDFNSGQSNTNDDSVNSGTNTTKVGSPPGTTRSGDRRAQAATNTPTSDGGNVVSTQYVGAVQSDSALDPHQDNQTVHPDKSHRSDTYDRGVNDSRSDPAYTEVDTGRGRNSRNEDHSGQHPQTQANEPRDIDERRTKRRSSQDEAHSNRLDSESRLTRNNGLGASQSGHSSESQPQSQSQSELQDHSSPDLEDSHRSHRQSNSINSRHRTVATRTNSRREATSGEHGEESINRSKDGISDTETDRESPQFDTHGGQSDSYDDAKKSIANPHWQVSIGLFTIVWAFASGLYGAGDTVTTFYALAAGSAVETNPIIRTALNIHPGVVVIVKVAILAGLYLLSQSVAERGEISYHSHVSVGIPVLLGGVGTYASFVNMQNLPAELFIYVILSIIFIGFAGGAIVALVEGIPLTASELSKYEFGQALRDSGMQGKDHSTQNKSTVDAAAEKDTHRESRHTGSSSVGARSTSGTRAAGPDHPRNNEYEQSNDSVARTRARTDQQSSHSRQPREDTQLSRDDNLDDLTKNSSSKHKRQSRENGTYTGSRRER